MAADWDLVYGGGFYVAHVVGNKLYVRATLIGNMGVNVASIILEHRECLKAARAGRTLR